MIKRCLTSLFATLIVCFLACSSASARVCFLPDSTDCGEGEGKGGIVGSGNVEVPCQYSSCPAYNSNYQECYDERTYNNGGVKVTCKQVRCKLSKSECEEQEDNPNSTQCCNLDSASGCYYMGKCPVLCNRNIYDSTTALPEEDYNCTSCKDKNGTFYNCTAKEKECKDINSNYTSSCGDSQIAEEVEGVKDSNNNQCYTCKDKPVEKKECKDIKPVNTYTDKCSDSQTPVIAEGVKDSQGNQCYTCKDKKPVETTCHIEDVSTVQENCKYELKLGTYSTIPSKGIDIKAGTSVRVWANAQGSSIISDIKGANGNFQRSSNSGFKDFVCEAGETYRLYATCGDFNCTEFPLTEKKDENCWYCDSCPDNSSRFQCSLDEKPGYKWDYKTNTCKVKTVTFVYDTNCPKATHSNMFGATITAPDNHQYTIGKCIPSQEGDESNCKDDIHESIELPYKQNGSYSLRFACVGGRCGGTVYRHGAKISSYDGTMSNIVINDAITENTYSFSPTAEMTYKFTADCKDILIDHCNGNIYMASGPYKNEYCERAQQLCPSHYQNYTICNNHLE